MDAEVAAALIGGVAGLLAGGVGVVATTANIRRQIRADGENTRRLIDAEHERATAQITAELRTAQAEIATRLEEAKQTQLTELIKKRLEVYPELYRIIAHYGRNWQLLGNTFDHAWASKFLEELIECNSRVGVFFSDDVYIAYGHLRDAVAAIRNRTAGGGVAGDAEMDEVLSIIRNRYWGQGLGTFMKDDCGTFQFGSLVARPREHKDALRQRLRTQGLPSN